jgi:hypothetical protein
LQVCRPVTKPLPICAIDALKNRNSYTRHVIQVITSTGDGKVHRTELETARSESREVQAAKHTAHNENINNFTDVFTEAPENNQKDKPSKPNSNSRRKN